MNGRPFSGGDDMPGESYSDVILMLARGNGTVNLLDVTNRGDIAIDPFLRVASSLIATQNTGRICRGVELDPLFVAVILQRFEAAAGDQAILVETGETFETLARRRTLEPALA
jgi:hypothetical protein